MNITNIRISEQEISSLLEYFFQRAKVYSSFAQISKISEQNNIKFTYIFYGESLIYSKYSPNIVISEQKTWSTFTFHSERQYIQALVLIKQKKW